ncbi:MAG TPA: hypothetical protein VM784_04625 [Actinomycetota bacterium]|nr:hypothetical protein [Actinomycetota bacterium]
MNSGLDTVEPRAPSSFPFSAIDEAIHILDAEPAPWSIQLEARVAGTFDQDRLRAAVQQALMRHPMAHARKVPASAFARGWRWEIPSVLDLDPMRIVQSGDDHALSSARGDLYSLSVPLAESPPVRVRIANHPGGDIIMLNVNHAAFDGFGSLRLLHSIARAYAGRPDPQAQVDVRKTRNVAALTEHRGSSPRARRVRLVMEKLSDFVGAPAQIAEQGTSERPGYGFHHVQLASEETDALISQRPPRATVNDVLVAALHVSIARWNEERDVAHRRIGVLVPTNLLPANSRAEFVGNFSVPVRVVTRPRHHSSSRDVLEAVAAQTQKMKREDTAAVMADLLSTPGRLPGWAKRALPALLWLTGNRLVDTAILSNLGKVDEMPSFGPDAGETIELWFSPPGRMPLGLAVGAVTAAGKLHLVFRYRHALLDAAAAADFANLYLTSLTKLV